MIYTLIVLVL